MKNLLWAVLLLGSVVMGRATIELDLDLDEANSFATLQLQPVNNDPTVFVLSRWYYLDGTPATGVLFGQDADIWSGPVHDGAGFLGVGTHTVQVYGTLKDVDGHTRYPYGPIEAQYTIEGPAAVVVPEPSTILAGCLLLLPFLTSSLRLLRS